MISIRIPTPLRNLSANKDEVFVEGATLKGALDDLEKRHPGFKERIMNEKGALRPYINVFHNDEDVRFGDGLNTALKDGDKLAIVPAIAGG
jgi:molybdopterin synthase sulfur carrier subunit